MNTDCDPDEDVDVDRARAGVQDRDDRIRLEAVVGFERVLQREHVDVDDDGRLPGLRDHVGVVGDLVLLRRDEQHFHAALRVLPGPGIENLVIEVDVLDVERDVLLGLPVDRLGELGFGHRRQGDLLDDHGIAGQRGDDVLRLELLVGKEAADGVGHGAAIDDGAVDDAVGRDRFDPEGRHAEPLPGGFQFDGLDGARPDVEAHEAFCSAEQHVTCLQTRPSWQTEYQSGRAC